jgi:peptidyl-prolyl cis-trans isomerase SurA
LTAIPLGMIGHGVQGRFAIRPVLMACLFAGLMGVPRPALAQVVLVVNGEVITNYDIEQRAKFDLLVTHKPLPRQQTIEELIDDKLKAQVARRYKIDITDKDVDQQYEARAKGMKISTDQLTQLLGQAGVDAKTFKAKLLADTSWTYIIRGKFQESFRFSEKSIDDAAEKKGDVGYDFTLRPILFLVPKGNTAALEARRKDADALRGRFVNCETGLPLARQLRDVIIRASINKNSSELMLPVLRETLNKTEPGHLTPVDVTEEGLQMFAVCEKKETTSETPEKKAALEKLMNEQFEKKSKEYLRELRRGAMIERK